MSLWLTFVFGCGRHSLSVCLSTHCVCMRNATVTRKWWCSMRIVIAGGRCSWPMDFVSVSDFSQEKKKRQRWTRALLLCVVERKVSLWQSTHQYIFFHLYWLVHRFFNHLFPIILYYLFCFHNVFLLKLYPYFQKHYRNWFCRECSLNPRAKLSIFHITHYCSLVKKKKMLMEKCKGWVGEGSHCKITDKPGPNLTRLWVQTDYVDWLEIEKQSISAYSYAGINSFKSSTKWMERKSGWSESIHVRHSNCTE